MADNADLEARAALQSIMIDDLEEQCLTKDAEIMSWRAKAERLETAIGHLHFGAASDAYLRAVRFEDGDQNPMSLSCMVTQLWHCKHAAQSLSVQIGNCNAHE